VTAARADVPADELPLGELKARHREQHLCFRCGHYAVCKVAGAIDPNLLITVTHCLMFEPAEAGEPEDEHAR
jgi:hypothetical protein